MAVLFFRRVIKLTDFNKIKVRRRDESTSVTHDCPSEMSGLFIFNENFKDADMKLKFQKDMKVFEDFISAEEEGLLYNEVEPILKRLRYEKYHWDDAIKGYREIEKNHWNSANKCVIDKIKKLAFSSGTEPLKLVHVLDLQPEGVIKPHVDNVRFCGNTIAGLSLLSDAVMRLRFDKDRAVFADVLLKRRSLYIMTGSARYDFAHEIMVGNDSVFGSQNIIKSRRISIVCRNEP